MVTNRVRHRVRQRINIAGSQFLNGVIGVSGMDCNHVTLTGNTLHDTREKPIAQHAIRFTGKGEGNTAAHNSLGKTSSKAIEGNVKTERNITGDK